MPAFAVSTESELDGVLLGKDARASGAKHRVRCVPRWPGDRSKEAGRYWQGLKPGNTCLQSPDEHEISEVQGTPSGSFPVQSLSLQYWLDAQCWVLLVHSTQEPALSLQTSSVAGSLEH